VEEDPNDVTSAEEADPELVRAVVAAARAEVPAVALEELATTGFDRGVTPANLMRACYGARDAIDAGAPKGTDDPAEDEVLDLMDRLTGWCHPSSRLPLPPK
jgi:hypothetical protein